MFMCKANYVVQYYLNHLCILNERKEVLWTDLRLLCHSFLGKGYLKSARFTLVHLGRY